MQPREEEEDEEEDDMQETDIYIYDVRFGTR
jgi:hypothetical protein